MSEALQLLWTDYTLRNVAAGTAVLGAVSGALGCFAVLRRRSLLGDAVSHAALPGIVLAWLLTGSKAAPVLVAGAGITGWLGAAAVSALARRERIREDTALALVLSVFFGAGLMLLTVVQGRPDASQAGLDTFLFGQAAALVERDVLTMGAVGGVAVLVLALFWKEFKLLSFDADAAAVAGYPVKLLDHLLTLLLVVAVVVGLQAVGVVLMSSLLIAPAAAARQWTNRLGRMVVLAAVIGAMSGALGAAVSGLAPGIPTGPAVVLAATAAFVVSLLFSPSRGLVSRRLRAAARDRRLRSEGDAS